MKNSKVLSTESIGLPHGQWFPGSSMLLNPWKKRWTRVCRLFSFSYLLSTPAANTPLRNTAVFMSRNTNSYFHTLQIPLFILNEIKSLVRNLSKHSSLLYVPSPHWHLLPLQSEQNLILLLPQRGALFTINLDEDTEADLSTHQGKNIR